MEAASVLVEGIHIDNDLVNFLKKENALDEFVKECKNSNPYERKLIVRSIAEAFIWSISELGNDYWEKKYKLHLDYISNPDDITSE